MGLFFVSGPRLIGVLPRIVLQNLIITAITAILTIEIIIITIDIIYNNVVQINLILHHTSAVSTTIDYP